MKCLDCNHEMTNYEAHTLAHKLSYDVCEKCGGLWLDQGELDKMAFQVEGDIEYCSHDEVKGPPETKNCPRCNVHLHKVKFLGESDIILDRCENCSGFWLDGGQLEKIDDELVKLMPVSGRGFSEFLTNTHLPHFYKRVKKDTSDNFSLAVLPFLAKDLGKSALKCPACEKAMESYKAYGVKFESCSACHGLWLHKGELKALKDKIDADSWGNLRWMNDEVNAIEKTSAMTSNKTCPQCKDCQLISTHFGNSKTMIDWCKKCEGIWLDYEEFETIMQYLRDELEHLTSKEMEHKVVQEVKRIWSDNSESKISEILDAKAAISTLVNINIFEHPALFNMVTNVSNIGKMLGA
jgi:Zn-finger nucleic acid-binding protein